MLNSLGRKSSALDLSLLNRNTSTGYQIALSMDVGTVLPSHSTGLILRWEISRVDDTRFSIQQSDIPYCIITFWSDRPESAANPKDTFILSQECEDEFGMN